MGSNYGPDYKSTTQRNDCSTPGAIYSTKITPSTIRLAVLLPLPVLPSEGKDEQILIGKLHEALLPAMEEFYRLNWHLFAGRALPHHKRIMPETWEELDPERHVKTAAAGIEGDGR